MKIVILITVIEGFAVMLAICIPTTDGASQENLIALSLSTDCSIAVSMSRIEYQEGKKYESRTKSLLSLPLL